MSKAVYVSYSRAILRVKSVCISLSVPWGKSSLSLVAMHLAGGCFLPWTLDNPHFSVLLSGCQYFPWTLGRHGHRQEVSCGHHLFASLTDTLVLCSPSEPAILASNCYLMTPGRDLVLRNQFRSLIVSTQAGISFCLSLNQLWMSQKSAKTNSHLSN